MSCGPAMISYSCWFIQVCVFFESYTVVSEPAGRHVRGGGGRQTEDQDDCWQDRASHCHNHSHSVRTCEWLCHYFNILWKFLYCIVLCCIVLCCVVLCCVVLCCVVLCCVVLSCLVLYCIVLYCIVLYCQVSGGFLPTAQTWANAGIVFL